MYIPRSLHCFTNVFCQPIHIFRFHVPKKTINNPSFSWIWKLWSWTQMATQQIYHIYNILQVWTMHIQLNLSDKLLQNYAHTIMWTFPMAKTKETPQTNTTTNYIRVSTYKILGCFILELWSTPIWWNPMLFWWQSIIYHVLPMEAQTMLNKSIVMTLVI
jgi:hypothetical protein